MKVGNSGISSLKVIFFLVAIAIITISIHYVPKPKPSIEVRCSLDPKTIKESERSELTLTLNNLDLRTHEIKILFDTSHRVSIYEGNEHPLQENAYTFVLEAADPSEQRVFSISGNLEAGTLSSQYPILFGIYVDGNELSKTWDAPVLTILKP